MVYWRNEAGEADDPKQVSITLHDAFGHEVHTRHMTLEGEVLNTTLPMDHMAAGLYLVHVTIDDMVLIERVVRQ